MQEDTMPLLQVRDFPEDMYRKITIAARKQNWTIIIINPKAGTKGMGYFRRTLRKYHDVFDYATFSDKMSSEVSLRAASTNMMFILMQAVTGQLTVLQLNL